MPSIDAIVGIPHSAATKLRRARVRTTDALLKRAAAADDRAVLAGETGVDAADLLVWCRRAEMLTVKGVGAEYAHLLSEIGVKDVDALASQQPADLLVSLGVENDRKRYVRRLPTRPMVDEWVSGAKQAPRIVEP